MNIKIKGVDIEVTEAIKVYATKKIYEALEKFVEEGKEKNILVEVELSKTSNHRSNGDIYKASAKVSGIHKNIFMETVKDDLYTAIDSLKDKLNENVSQMKDKKKTLSHRIALRFKKIFKGQD